MADDRSMQAEIAAVAARIAPAAEALDQGAECASFAAALDAAAPPPTAVTAPAGTGRAPSPTAWPASPADWTVTDMAAAIAARRISSLEATDACLARIAERDFRLRSFIHVDADGARTAARARDAELAAGRARGPLHGVPFAYKDLLHVAGLPTSCGTRVAEYFTADGDATIVSRLTAAGTVTLGKLNMTELALGPFGDNAHHGDARNPWRLGHVTGGSSSGAGAAVAGGLAPAAIGSDTGGSIRLPSACCGIAGLKPTYGRVSRAGGMILSWSLDHMGPMARTVRDVALLFGVIAGADPRDPTASSRAVPDAFGGLDGGVRGLRIGVPSNYYFDGIDAEMSAGVRAAIEVLAKQGADVREIAVPDPAGMIAVCTLVARAEGAAVHGAFVRARPNDVQPAVRARVALGFHVSAYDYLQACRLRARLVHDFARTVFSTVDVLAAPVIPELAPTLASIKAGTTDEVVQRMGRFSRLTRPFNGLGLPALALPCGFSAAGLPLALQVVGRPFDEATVLRVGHAYQQVTDWHARRPAEAG